MNGRGMPSLRLAFTVWLLSAAATAFAQNAPVTTARAVIESIAPDGASLTVRTRGGDEKTIHLPEKTTVTLVVPAALTDVKPGAVIGVAACRARVGN